MEVLMYTGRPKPLFWVELAMARVALSGTPMHIVSCSREQAGRTFEAAKSLVNRDPKADTG